MEIKLTFKGGNMSFIQLGASSTKDFIDNLNSNFDKISEIYPVGSIWMGGRDSNNTPVNPRNLFGGTWKLIDKEFERLRYHPTKSPNISEGIEEEYRKRYDLDNYIAKVYIDDVNYKLGNYLIVDELYVSYHGHSVSITISGTGDTSTTASQDETLEFFSLELNEVSETAWGIELTKTPDGKSNNPIQPKYVVAYDDGGNQIAMLQIKGEPEFGYIGIYSVDMIPHIKVSSTDDDYYYKAQRCNMTFELDLLSRDMKDEFCDKFYWQRIA